MMTSKFPLFSFMYCTPSPTLTWTLESLRLSAMLGRCCLLTSITLCSIELRKTFYVAINLGICGVSSKFVSSSIMSWQILTGHAQPFRGARDLASCLKVPLDSLLVWASSGGSGETARMRRLAWTFAARIGDKYQIRLMRPISIL